MPFVPRHLLLNDDGTEPDDWSARRKHVLQSVRKQYADLDFAAQKERERHLRERIEEMRPRLRRLDNAVKFYRLAKRVTLERAKRHGVDTPLSDALEPGASAADGWRREVSGGWAEEAKEPPSASWEPTVNLLEEADVEPDTPHLPQRLDFEAGTTWRDVLKEIRTLEAAEQRDRQRVRRELEEAEFRRVVLRDLLDETIHGEPLLDQPESTQSSSQGGRKRIIDDPETYFVEETLQAVLEWTAEKENKGKPFRSKAGSTNTLCGYVAQQLEEETDYPMSQDTIKDRLRAIIVEGLQISLPHGYTNARSYFQARSKIVEAARREGLLSKNKNRQARQNRQQQ